MLHNAWLLDRSHAPWIGIHITTHLPKHPPRNLNTDVQLQEIVEYSVKPRILDRSGGEGGGGPERRSERLGSVWLARRIQVHHLLALCTQQSEFFCQGPSTSGNR